MSEMLKTPLNKLAKDAGGQMVEFAGWEMPIRFGSILDERRQVRTAAGFFDVSHMGRVRFSGRHARKFLETVLTRRVTTMKEMTCRYALVCNEQGGVLDDVILYRFPEDWLLVVNASNRAKLLAHFKQVIEQNDFAVKMDDQTTSTAMVAVQGPKAMELVSGFSKEIPTLKRYEFRTKNLLILKMHVSRTGYTGEDGIEIILPAGTATMALKLLLKDHNSETSVVKPCGLGARDTLRMEAGMPLYGHELDEQTNPLEAGLDFAVNLDKGEEPDGPPVPTFIGQEALKQAKAAGLKKKLVGLAFEGKRSPRQGMKVLADGGEVGVVTSGCVSPTLEKPIAMAYVKPEFAAAGTKLSVDLGRQALDGEVVKLPFYSGLKK